MDGNFVGLAAVVMIFGIPMAAMYTFFRVRKLRSEERLAAIARGVDVPMPVILVGALGGMATGGIIGMFVGATLLALAWQISTGWVDENPDADILPGA